MSALPAIFVWPGSFGPLAGTVVPFVAASAVKATVVLAVACILAFALRRCSAATRHLVWAMALAWVLAVPLLSLILPRWHIALPDLPNVSDAAGPGVAAAAPAAPRLPPRGDAQVSAGTAVEAPSRAYPIALLAWAAGLLVLLVRLGTGVGRLRWLTSRARRIDNPAMLRLVAQLSALVELRRTVAVVTSDNVRVPMTWRLFRPLILLPGGAAGWPEDRLRLVLCHELLHVKRFDFLTQLLAQIVCALYWFHPLAWVAALRLRDEREFSCDDRVLQLGARAWEYAGHLVALASTLPIRGERYSTAVAMAQPSNLERRLVSMFNPNANRKGVSAAAAFAVVLALACLVLPLAAVRISAENPGTLSGIVRDASGRPVPAATVIVSSLTSDRKEIGATNSQGEFRFTSLPEDNYSIEVRKRGFAALEWKGIDLKAGAERRIEGTLELGKVSESLDVVAKSPAVAPGTTEPGRIPVGGEVQATKLISMAKPVYPERAKQNGIQGTVLLRAVIGTDGTLIGLKALNTQVDPDLVQAAVDAVKQWRYEPTRLNGHAVEVVTTITVNFRLEP